MIARTGLRERDAGIDVPRTLQSQFLPLAGPGFEQQLRPRGGQTVPQSVPGALTTSVRRNVISVHATVLWRCSVVLCITLVNK